MANVSVERNCFSCGKKTVLEVDYHPYLEFLSGKSVQVAFPNMNSFDREVLISGMCHDCQSKVFNKPKPGEDWGEIVCECPECGYDIYPNNKQGDVYICPSCCFPIENVKE